MTTGVHVARTIAVLRAEARRWTAIRVSTPLVVSLLGDHEAVEAIQALHSEDTQGRLPVCAECGTPWPCHTIRTISDTREDQIA